MKKTRLSVTATPDVLNISSATTAYALRIADLMTTVTVTEYATKWCAATVVQTLAMTAWTVNTAR